MNHSTTNGGSLSSTKRPIVHILPANRHDAAAIARTYLRSFVRNPHFPVLFPQYVGLSNEELLRVGLPIEARRFRQCLVGPDISMKAIVLTTNQQNETVQRIVGYASWSSPNRSRKRTWWEWFLAIIVYPIYNFFKPIRIPPEVSSAMQLAAEQYDEAFKSGGKWDGRIRWSLHSLCVDPDWQGLGVASALIEWGFEKARQSDSIIYLEASPVGLPIYTAKGFQVVVNKPREICGMYVEAPGMIWDPRLNLKA